MPDISIISLLISFKDVLWNLANFFSKYHLEFYLVSISIATTYWQQVPGALEAKIEQFDLN